MSLVKNVVPLETLQHCFIYSEVLMHFLGDFLQKTKIKYHMIVKWKKNDKQFIFSFFFQIKVIKVLHVFFIFPHLA